MTNAGRWSSTIRGYWSCRSIGDAGALADESGQGRTLTANNNPTIVSANSGQITYANLVGASTQYYSRADEAGLDITGTEATIAAPGLTITGWAYFAALGSSETIMCKYGAAGQRSFLFQKPNGNTVAFSVTAGGTTMTQVVSSGTLTATAYWFVACRFTPSTELAVWRANGTTYEKTTNTTTIPASIFNSTTSLTVGTLGTLANYMTGRLSRLSLHCAALTDGEIAAIYQEQRLYFGV
jgi:hypothetical protein